MSSSAERLVSRAWFTTPIALLRRREPHPARAAGGRYAAAGCRTTDDRSRQGGTFIFTRVTQDRRPILSTAPAGPRLRAAVVEAQGQVVPVPARPAVPAARAVLSAANVCSAAVVTGAAFWAVSVNLESADPPRYWS